MQRREAAFQMSSDTQYAEPELWEKPITAADLRYKQQQDEGDENNNPDRLPIPAPTHLTKKSTPTTELVTVTEKPIADPTKSSLFDLNGAPLTIVLRRFPQCRLRYPDRPLMEFWLQQDVDVPTPIVGMLADMGIFEKGDIWVWVHEPAVVNPDDRFNLPNGGIQLALLVPDNKQIFLSCDVYTNHQCIPSYKHSRRTGFLILKGLRYSTKPSE